MQCFEVAERLDKRADVRVKPWHVRVNADARIIYRSGMMSDDGANAAQLRAAGQQQAASFEQFSQHPVQGADFNFALPETSAPSSPGPILSAGALSPHSGKHTPRHVTNVPPQQLLAAPGHEAVTLNTQASLQPPTVEDAHQGPIAQASARAARMAQQQQQQHSMVPAADTGTGPAMQGSQARAAADAPMQHSSTTHAATTGVWPMQPQLARSLATTHAGDAGACNASFAVWAVASQPQQQTLCLEDDKSSPQQSYEAPMLAASAANDERRYYR